jgi:hypothetical protein
MRHAEAVIVLNQREEDRYNWKPEIRENEKGESMKRKACRKQT